MYLNANNNFENFLHPTYGYKIPIIFDTCHMVKLVRNIFASKEINTCMMEMIVQSDGNL